MRSPHDPSQPAGNKILFITQDRSLLNPAQSSLDTYLDIAALFTEVHVLVLCEGKLPKNPMQRPASNLWLYAAAAPVWWLLPQAGVQLARDQLQFGSGFQPDLIVACDPFASALVADRLGKRFDRPTQLHIPEDYTSLEYRKKQNQSLWQRSIPRLTIPRFKSVRTGTANLSSTVREKYRIADCATLPRFNNFQNSLARTDALDLAAQFKPISAFLVYAGALTHDSSLFTVLQATAEILKDRHIGLLVLGDGPEQRAFVQQTKTLGIDQQVIFLPAVQDVVPYLLSADLVLVTDTDSYSETIALQAGAAGAPMIMSRTEHRDDLFTHQSSAYFCNPNDPVSIRAGAELLLKHAPLRKHFADSSKRIMRETFHVDEAEYKRAYRASITESFWPRN